MNDACRAACVRCSYQTKTESSVSPVNIWSRSVQRRVTRSAHIVFDDVAAWCSGNDFGRTSEVTLHRTRLGLGSVTFFGLANHFGM